MNGSFFPHRSYYLLEKRVIHDPYVILGRLKMLELHNCRGEDEKLLASYKKEGWCHSKVPRYLQELLVVFPCLVRKCF